MCFGGRERVRERCIKLDCESKGQSKCKNKEVVGAKVIKYKKKWR